MQRKIHDRQSHIRGNSLNRWEMCEYFFFININRMSKSCKTVLTYEIICVLSCIWLTIVGFFCGQSWVLFLLCIPGRAYSDPIQQVLPRTTKKVLAGRELICIIVSVNFIQLAKTISIDWRVLWAGGPRFPPCWHSPHPFSPLLATTLLSSSVTLTFSLSLR